MVTNDAFLLPVGLFPRLQTMVMAVASASSSTGAAVAKPTLWYGGIHLFWDNAIECLVLQKEDSRGLVILVRTPQLTPDASVFLRTAITKTVELFDEACFRSCPALQKADFELLVRWELAWEELEIGAVIGQGAYGTVSAAVWRNMAVAVKVVSGSELLLVIALLQKHRSLSKETFVVKPHLLLARFFPKMTQFKQ